MTPLFRVICIVVFAALAGCATNSHTPTAAVAATQNDRLAGVWAGVDESGKEGALILEKNGRADLIRDGKSATKTLVRGNGTIEYEYNSNTDPHTFDLVLTLNTGETKRLPGTLRFIAPDTIEVTMFDDKILLHRQKDSTLGKLDQ